MQYNKVGEVHKDIISIPMTVMSSGISTIVRILNLFWILEYNTEIILILMIRLME